MTRSECGKLGWEKTKLIHRVAFEKRKEEYNKNPKKCLYCLEPLSYKDRYKIFCDSKCSAIYNNTHKKKKGEGKICSFCNLPFYSKFDISKYCSLECSSSHQYAKSIKKWKNGESKGYSGKTLQICVWLRRYLFEKFNSKCCKCGWCEINTTTNKVPLEVNHIDGDASNNSESNLELICPNCHSLTPNFRALNRGSKRNRKSVGCQI